MVNIRKDKLTEGLVLADHITGINNVQLKKDTVLSQRLVNIIKNTNLFTLENIPVTLQSYNTHLLRSTEELRGNVFQAKKEFSKSMEEDFKIEKTDDENYKTIKDLSNIKEEINIPGNLIVNGDIINCSSLYVADKLTVLGNVKNSNITAKNEIIIYGSILNDRHDYRINTFGTIKVESINKAIINADIIKIKESVKNSEMAADKTIECPTTSQIKNSKLQAGLSIIIGNVNDDSALIIFSEKQEHLFKKLFMIEKKLNEFNKEIEPLQQSINIFRILKNRINELSPDKRNELISNIKLVKAKIEKKKFLSEQFVTLKVEAKKIKESRQVNPIIIDDVIEKGTKVVIDNSTFVVSMTSKGVVFYKKSMIIMGKKDKEWGSIS